MLMAEEEKTPPLRYAVHIAKGTGRNLTPVDPGQGSGEGEVSPPVAGRTRQRRHGECSKEKGSRRDSSGKGEEGESSLYAPSRRNLPPGVS